MKKFLTMLLICMLVLSIMVALVSCRRDDPKQENPETPGTETPDTVEGGGGTSDGKIDLPPIKVPGLTPEPEE